MSLKRFPIQIRLDGTSKEYSVEFQTAQRYAKGWRTALQRAYQGAQLTCQCFGRGEKRIAVRRLDGADSFFLARFPNSGPQHSVDCIYYAPDTEFSGIGAYEKDVIEERPSGAWRVKLALGIQAKREPALLPAHATTRLNGTARKPSISLLALLHFLWTQSRLNAWHPNMEGKRNLGLVHSLLAKTAKAVRVRRLSLHDVLLLATPHQKGGQATRNREQLEKAARAYHRMLVIAPLAKHSAEREAASNDMIPIAGFHGIPRLHLHPSVWCRTLTRFARQVAAWRKGMRAIIIAHTEPPHSADSSRLEVLDISVMIVSEQWIPVDSLHEAQVEEVLRQQTRSFFKPLMYDATSDVFFPDFWLTDMGGIDPMAMEVFGMNTDDYLKRKAEKFVHYNQKYGVAGWWHWDVLNHERMPALPKRP